MLLTFSLYSYSCACIVIPCFCVCFPVLSPCPVAAASARRCHSIYKGFAQCLMALGDSLTDSARKDEDTHEIHSICRWINCTHAQSQIYHSCSWLWLFVQFRWAYSHLGRDSDETKYLTAHIQEMSMQEKSLDKHFTVSLSHSVCCVISIGHIQAIHWCRSKI